MAYIVHRSQAFEADYDQTLYYLTQVLYAHRAALSLADALEDTATMLADNPYLHAVSQKASLERLGLRECQVLGYVLIYSIQNETVSFARLFHQSQSYDSVRYDFN